MISSPHRKLLMSKILVLGASGMAGHVIASHLSEQGYSVDTVSGSKKLNDSTILINVLDIAALQVFLSSRTYDTVINCIGMLVKDSELNKDRAVFLNSYLPHFLEKYYEKSSTRVIHLSTDCVFSGKNAPYKESAWYDGELFYDRTKALGEINNQKDLTFRMSIIGPDLNKDGIGLFNWFYSQTGTISGYSRAIWTGVTTIELARAIEAAMKQNLTGLYHLVPDKNISKFELLELFKLVFVRDDIYIDEDTSISLDKTLVRTRTDFDYKVKDYKQMIIDMKEWIDDHEGFYPHYRKK